MKWIERVGFNAHTARVVYDITKTKAGLAYFGVTLVRDNNPGGPALFGAGYRVIVVIDTMDPAQAQAHVNTALSGPTPAWAIECVNEPADLAAAAKVNAAIVAAAAGRCRVLTSPLNLPNPARAAMLGPQAGTHMASIHSYRADRTDAQWAPRVAASLADAQTMAPFLPVAVTETGLWVGPATPPMDPRPGPNQGKPWTHHPTDPQLAVAQVRPNLLGFWAAGVEYVIYYELLDEPLLLGPEARFGWLNVDGSPKPWAVELKTMLGEIGAQDCIPHGPDPMVAALQAQLASMHATHAAAVSDVDAAMVAVQRVAATLGR